MSLSLIHTSNHCIIELLRPLGKSPLQHHFVPTWDLQDQAAGLREVTVLGGNESVDSPGSEAVASTGGQLEWDVDWLAMGGGRK